MALVAGLVVDDVHLAVVVDPKLADDDVVHGRVHLAPRVVVARLFEIQVGDAERYDLQVLAPELARHGELLPQLPVAALAVLGQHRRVVTHLQRTPNG